MNADLTLQLRIVFEKSYFPEPLLPRHPFAQTYTCKDVPSITGKCYKNEKQTGFPWTEGPLNDLRPITQEHLQSFQINAADVLELLKSVFRKSEKRSNSSSQTCGCVCLCVCKCKEKRDSPNCHQQNRAEGRSKDLLKSPGVSELLTQETVNPRKPDTRASENNFRGKGPG